MTVQEAITQTDALVANVLEPEQKRDFLSRLDGRIYEEIIQKFEGAHNTFVPYGDDDLDKTLIVPEPYSVIYLHWLEAQISYYNGEWDRYNVSISMFNNDYSDFSRWFGGSHRRKSYKILY